MALPSQYVLCVSVQELILLLHPGFGTIQQLGLPLIYADMILVFISLHENDKYCCFVL